MRQFAYLILLLAAITACSESAVRDRDRSVGHFSITRLLADQPAKLTRQNVQMTKTVVLDGVMEQHETDAASLDSTDWQKELKFLHEAEIDRPAYRGIYDIDSSGQSLEYRLKEGEESSVTWLKVTYQNGLPSLVEADLVTQNVLYRTERHISLAMGNEDGEGMLLKSFSTQGYQKLVMRDSTTYAVETRVR